VIDTDLLPPAIVATARAAEDHVPATLTEAGINLNAMVRELDGKVDAIGLGGIDVYLYAGKHRFALRDGLRLLEAAKRVAAGRNPG